MLSALSKTRPSFAFTSVPKSVLREHLAAYLFLLPATGLIFLFNVFPVIFAFFVSLHEWSIFPENFNGLANYEKSLGDFAFVLFFWISLGLIYLSFRLLQRFLVEVKRARDRFYSLLAAALFSAAALAFSNWLLLSLPLVVDSPRRLPPVRHSAAVFISEFLRSFQFPKVIQAGNLFLLITLVAIVGITLLMRRDFGRATQHFRRSAPFCLTFVIAIWMLWTTYRELLVAVSRATNRLPILGALLAPAQALAGLQLPAPATPPTHELPIWSQIILISSGAILLFLAYRLWQHAHHRHDRSGFFWQALASLALMLGGYLLIIELPLALEAADEDLLNGFGITAMYSLGTVPVQLSIGLLLAYLLFQKIRGKVLFRLIYFLPYTMPFAATAVVFKVFFGQAQNSTLNNFWKALGFSAQKWLQEPTGIFHLLFGSNLPDFLAGPSLALVIIMIYSNWTYIGFDTVVFLAGLGNIPSELYEAARIDGASGWRIFRHITLPLLSPTTFFLSLIAIIGTFQAFTQIWIMRSPATARAVDTASIYMFETIRTTRPQYGYGAAMAFVLFLIILILTVAQNRVVGRRVFYG